MRFGLTAHPLPAESVALEIDDVGFHAGSFAVSEDRQPWLPAKAAFFSASPEVAANVPVGWPSHHSGRRLAVTDRYELAVLDRDDGHFLVRRARLVREVCIAGYAGEAGDGEDGVVDRLRIQISR